MELDGRPDPTLDAHRPTCPHLRSGALLAHLAHFFQSSPPYTSWCAHTAPRTATLISHLTLSVARSRVLSTTSRPRAGQGPISRRGLSRIASKAFGAGSAACLARPPQSPLAPPQPLYLTAVSTSFQGARLRRASRATICRFSDVRRSHA